jgi:hypothetical protein
MRSNAPTYAFIYVGFFTTGKDKYDRSVNAKPNIYTFLKITLKKSGHLRVLAEDRRIILKLI